MLQKDNITISSDFLRLTAPAAMPGHLGAVSLKKPHDIVISSFCNIVKGQANYAYTYMHISKAHICSHKYHDAYILGLRKSQKYGLFC